MRTTTIIAVALIVLGIAALGYQGFTYTTKEKVVDLGPLEVTSETTKTFPLPPVVGIIALAGGVILLVIGKRRG
ncbi:hypothetical protein [Fundidesulfovibrio putealis]|uniref:hypothetical protein n=1 Tax=Fundidesulfovibrio putealis TaxID=270496 RepID=UPI0004823500|nr:hypothetical protein [Fundidesulfovibrio putealis]